MKQGAKSRKKQKSGGIKKQENKTKEGRGREKDRKQIEKAKTKQLSKT